MNDARILIVDDDPALLEALPRALQLRLEGIGIDTSETAADALERIREQDYDAIVTDIKMPGMDGLALLGEIRSVRPRTPTLLITGHGEHDLAVQALRGGAYDFVQKPIDRDYFVASLERAIQLRRLDREVERQRQALERHARVLEHVDDGVFLVDETGVIRHWNPAAAGDHGAPRGRGARQARRDGAAGLGDDRQPGPRRGGARPREPRRQDRPARARRAGALALDLGREVRGRRRLRVPEPDRGARPRRAQGRVRGHGLARAAHAARRDLRLRADAAPQGPRARRRAPREPARRDRRRVGAPDADRRRHPPREHARLRPAAARTRAGRPRRADPPGGGGDADLLRRARRHRDRVRRARSSTRPSRATPTSCARS